MKALFSVALVIAVAGTAMAGKPQGSGEALEAAPGFTGPTGDVRTGLITGVNVAGIPSFDAVGTPGNVVLNINLGPNATVNGIGWDVVIEALGSSWLSEVSVSFGDSAGNDFVFLRVGAGSNFPAGPTPFASGGIIKLADVGLPDIVLADGILQLEFFESFDDVAGAADGNWLGGQLFIQYVPTPGAVSLMGLAGVGLISRRRR